MPSRASKEARKGPSYLKPKKGDIAAGGTTAKGKAKVKTGGTKARGRGTAKTTRATRTTKARRVSTPTFTGATATGAARTKASKDPALKSNAATGLNLTPTEQRQTNKAFTGKEEGLTLPEMAAKSAEAAAMIAPIPVAQGVKAVGAAAKLAKTASKVEKAAQAGKAGEAAAQASKAAKAAKEAERAADTAKKASRAKRAATAPKRAAKRTKAGGKALRQKGGVKSAGKRAKRGAAIKAGQHPAVSTAGIYATADQAGVDAPIVDEVGAIAEGVATANVGKSLKTTARAVPGILTGVAAPVAATAETAYRAGRKNLDAANLPGGKDYSAVEIVAPVVNTTEEMAKGSVELAKPWLSGDPDQIRKSVEDDLGYIMLVPGPKAASAVRGSKAYKATRGKARDAVETRRASKRHAERDTPGNKRKAKPSVDDSIDGGQYISRTVGNKLENRRRRAKWSKDVARNKAAAIAEGGYAAGPVREALSKVKAPKGASKKQYRASASDSVAFVAAHGIPRDRAAAMKYLDKIEAGIAKPDPDLIPRTAKGEAASVLAPEVIDFLRRSPELFDDANYWKAVDAYKAGARTIESSERKRYAALAGTYGVKMPEERMADGVRVGDKIIKSRDLTPELRTRYEQQIRAFRKEQRAADKEARRHDPASPEHLKAIERSLEARTKADELATVLRNHNLAYKQALKDYVREAEAIRRREGLEDPAYVKMAEDRTNALDSHPEFPRGRMAAKQHRDMDVVRRRGTADYSFNRLLTNSMLEPRMKREMHKQTSRFVSEEGVSLTMKNGKKRRYVTSQEIRRAVNRGELDPKQYAVFHSQHFKQAVLDKKARKDAADEAGTEFGTIEDLATFAKEVDGRALDKGHKYVVVRKEAARELAHQFNGKDGFWAKANRGASRVILGYNPSWAAAQLLAEGIPAAVAIGANFARWNRIRGARREGRTMSDRNRAAVDAAVGKTAGIDTFPRPGFDFRRGKDFSEVARLTPRDKTAGFLMDVAKGNALSRFDRYKGGQFRKAVAAAHIDKGYRGYLRGLGGGLKLTDELNKKLAGMSLAERQAWISRNPKYARQLEKYVDDVMGNWRAVSRLESRFAPGIAFYPYVRYSFKWILHGFPKRHPAKASILYFLSQQNAEQLEKIVGGPVADWLNYAYPVVSDEDGPSVLPAAARISPALNAAVSAVGGDNLNRILTGANPFVGAVYQGVSGNDPFTGEQITAEPREKALLGLAAFASMFAPARFLDEFDGVPGIDDFKPRRGFEGPIVGGQSETSKTLEALDPNRVQRSIVNVLAPQSGEDFRIENEFIRQLQNETAYEPGGFMYEGGESGGSDDSEGGGSPSAAEMFGGSSPTKKAKRSSSPTAAEMFGG